MSGLHPIIAQALAGIAPPARVVDWKVTVEFFKGPAFSTNAAAADEAGAVRLAKAFARGCGYTGEVRSAKAVRA